VEDPGYPPLRDVFSAMGAVICPVRVDHEGVVVDDIPREAAIICVTPSHQFPLGVVMSPHRRLSLLARAEASNAVIVEDDYDGEFRFHSRPLDALQTLDRESRVFYVGTFSKCMSPSLRLGFVVCPPWAKNALVRAKHLSDRNCSMANQEALAAFISEGHLARHIRHMRGVYGERRRALLAAVGTYCTNHLEPFAAMAGLHIAARLQWMIDAEEVVSRAAAAGVGIRSIAEFAARKTTLAGFVFGYGAVAEGAIEAGIQHLSCILQRVGSATRRRAVQKRQPGNRHRNSEVTSLAMSRRTRQDPSRR
jgi:GntR family transcriptional regulator/MocR family aminotransferase